MLGLTLYSSSGLLVDKEKQGELITMWDKIVNCYSLTTPNTVLIHDSAKPGVVN